MARYFFDIVHGQQVVRDENGQDFANLDEARKHASIALADMARDYFPNARAEHDIVVFIRDEAGAITRATIKLDLDD